MQPEAKWEKRSLFFFALPLCCALLFTTFHSAIYNWVFLPKIFPQGGLPLFINMDMVRQYWSWGPGKVLVILNILLFLLPFACLKFLSREKKP